MISEWDPILTEKMNEYMSVRLNDNFLEMRMNSYQHLTFRMDARAIPQLIKALERMEKKI